MTETSPPIVLDPATMAAALTRLYAESNTGRPWRPAAGSFNEGAQWRFLDWYYQNVAVVQDLSDLKVEGSSDANVLNKFLVDNGFKPMFREIAKGGVGACAIVDILVEWAVKASLLQFGAYDIDRMWTQYQAFEVPIQGAEIFSVPGTSEQLAKLNTTDGGAVWLLVTNRPEHGLDLLETAVSAMATRQRTSTQWISSVIVPTIKIDAEVSLSWMLGVNTGDRPDDHHIDQAFQLFKLAMNEKGARVKVGTGLATSREPERRPEPLQFDQPFAGWITQRGSNVPIAPFYADQSTWKSDVSLNNL